MRFQHSARSRAGRQIGSALLGSGIGGQRVTTALVERLEPRALLSASVGGAGELIMLPTVPDPVEGIAAPPGGLAALSQPGFQIQIVFPDDSLTPSQRAIFAGAAERWQSVILGDIPDIPFEENGTVVTIDDLRITASALSIDGVGGILGQAGPEHYRVRQALPNYNFLPLTGKMQFDSADVAALEAAGQLDEVILHEMGHVLGLGRTLWEKKGVISGAGTDDPRYAGALGNAQYQAIFGLPAGDTAPIENTGNPGTRDSHWREATFGIELMTGFLNGATTLPMSLLTVAQYADFGYPSVNLNAADIFARPGGGGNAYPTLGSLNDAADPTPLNTPILLTANGAADPDGTVAGVRFYRESNGIPGLQVTAAGAVVSDVQGDLLLATDSNPADGFSALVPTTALPAGTYTYYAQPTDNQNLIGIDGEVSTTNSILASATPVLQSIAVNDGTAQRSMVKSLSLVFDQPVTLAGGATTLVQLNNAAPTDASGILSAPTTSDGGVTWTCTFVAGSPFMQTAVANKPTGSLVDGIYTLSLDRTKVSAAGSGVPMVVPPASLTFHRLYGDINGDKRVNAADFNAFRHAFGTYTAFETFGFDYDSDGAIRMYEYLQFRNRFGKALVY